MSSPTRRRRPRPGTGRHRAPETGQRAVILLLFALSGVSALIYQVIWARQLTLIFGATAPAITTVLASFMLGLALGSHAAGRRAHRWGNPLRAYALIEFGIAGSAVAFPFVLSLLTLVHVALFRLLMDAPVLLGTARVLLAAAVLLVPTTLMGASLPVLTRALVRDGGALGREAGMLYGVNTLGAAAGVYLATFFLIPEVGLTGGWLAAAALNALIGVVAWRYAGTWRLEPTASAETASPLPSRRWVVLVAYGCAGLAALGYEVVWARLLVLVFGSSVYAFAVMLAGFLLGLGTGGLVGGWLSGRSSSPAAPAAALQVLIAVSVLAGAPWFDRLPELFLAAFRLSGGQWWALTTLQFLMAVGLMIVPTMAMGAAFPLTARLLRTAHGAERAVGDAYAVNTWGAIVGAAVTGFALVPWLGFRGSLVALATVNILAAGLLLMHATPRPGWRRWALPVPAIALVLTVAVLPGWSAKTLSSGVYVYADRYTAAGFERLLEPQRVLFYREGSTATVAVMEGQWRFLRINGKTDAGDSPDNLTQRLLAHVPLLLHPEPRSVLVVGLGTGITLGSALLHPIEHVDAIEVSPEVVEASRFFVDANGRALEDPRTRLRILDARTWLMAAPTPPYDVIISEPSNPWQTGNANLFTLDHYRLTRSRLSPAGVFCQWLPFYRMDEADFKAAIRTFQTVFPETTVWFSGADILLVGSARPLAIDPAQVAARAMHATIAKSLREIGIPDGAALLGYFMLDPQRVRDYVGGAGPLHTDNYPLLEFSAPKTLYRESAPEILAALRHLSGTSELPLASGAERALPSVHLGIARQKLLLRMPEAALAVLERAAGIDRDHADVRRLQALGWNQIGEARFHQNDSRGAAAAFERALRLIADEPDIHVNAAFVLAHGREDPARAEEHLRTASRLRPAHPVALVVLGRLLAEQRRWSEAEEVWRQVLARDPSNDEALQALATTTRLRLR